MKFKRFFQGVFYFGSLILPLIDIYRGVKKGIQDNYHDDSLLMAINRRKFYESNR